MKAQSKRKKKLLVAAAALALIAASSGTFAWITSRDARINRVDAANTANDTTKIYEKWIPAPLVAGTETTKEVKVANEGTANVFVRVSYEEVLKHLADKGETKWGKSTDSPTPKYSYVANDSGLGKNMPVIDSSAADVVANGFKQVPAANVTGLEPDTELWVKGATMVHPVTGDTIAKPEVRFFHRVAGAPAPGMFQETKAEIDYKNVGADGTPAEDYTWTVKNTEYKFYEGGYTYKTVNWAKSSLPDELGNKTDYSLLGTSGTRHLVDYDYTTGVVGALNGVQPAVLSDQIPTGTAGGSKNGVQADTFAFTKSMIRIGYSEDITTVAGLATTTTPKWVYNKDDGWFYYTEALKPSAETPDLLKKLHFDSGMGKEYDNASYDLVVKMEAIQTTKEALTDASGWGMPSTGDTATILAHLEGKI
ncbi:hypothetical protein NRIC_35740 [Enterococcus florum]|uniref:Alternate signal-mediated exported protein n=1 Tax=Enterococcus florum TaxID=2480627 RepID=A0A4P5PSW9_9ENTE|nr:hypothetical protein [Enterococcus florum]GCF95683.1 hypothetical protein NRIC_35740 [Enterococcus florum]